MNLSSNSKLIIWWITWIAIAVATYWMLGQYRLPLIIGFLLAYVLQPLGEMGDRWRIPRWLLAVLGILLLMFITFTIMALVLPKIVSELYQLAEKLPALLQQLSRTFFSLAVAIIDTFIAIVPDAANSWLSELRILLIAESQEGSPGGSVFWQQLGELLLTNNGDETIAIQGAADVLNLLASLLGNIYSWIPSFISGVSARFGDFFTFLLAIVLFLVTYLFLFSGWPQLTAKITLAIPSQARNAVTAIFSSCDDVLSGYFRGMLILVLVMTSYYCLVYSLVQVPYAFLLGLVTGLLTLLPFVGFIVSGLLLVLVTLLPQVLWQALALGIVGLLVGQALENFVMTPRLVGQKIGLYPLVTILAILVFGQLWGISGILIAVPTTAIVFSLIQTWNNWLQN